MSREWFPLKSLMIGDIIMTDFTDHEAQFGIIETGDSPTAILVGRGDPFIDEGKRAVVQIMGSLDVSNSSVLQPFCGGFVLVDAQLYFVELEGGYTPKYVHAECLSIWRDGRKMFGTTAPLAVPPRSA